MYMIHYFLYFQSVVITSRTILLEIYMAIWVIFW